MSIPYSPPTRKTLKCVSHEGCEQTIRLRVDEESIGLYTRSDDVAHAGGARLLYKGDGVSNEFLVEIRERILMGQGPVLIVTNLRLLYQADAEKVSTMKYRIIIKI